MKFCDLTQFYSPASGGVKRYIAEKVAYLRRERPDDTHVLIVPGAESRVETDGPARVHFIRSPLISRATQYRALLDLEAVSRAIENEHPDVIECSDPYQLAWRAQSVGESLDIPVFGYYHSHFAEAYVESPLRKWLGDFPARMGLELARGYTMRVYNRFARTLVPSPALVETLAAWGVENAVLAELGMDRRTFFPSDAPPDSARSEWPVQPGQKVLLYVGRLAPEKNVDRLFEAFRELHRRKPGAFHLVVIGDGNDRPQLEAARRQTAQITWLPGLPAAALARHYRGADLFVHPGVLETFGLVTLEAQACGLPVCGIRGTRMDRIVFRGLEHWAEADTAPALADAIQRLSALDLRGLGREAAAEARERYDWDVRFAHIFGLYESVRRERADRLTSRPVSAAARRGRPGWRAA